MHVSKVTNEVLRAELNATVAEYAGLEIDAVTGEYYADPQNAGVYAGRVAVHGRALDILIDPDREVEEVEFPEWPPRVARWAGG